MKQYLSLNCARPSASGGLEIRTLPSEWLGVKISFIFAAARA
jgi:hypothetical protein